MGRKLARNLVFYVSLSLLILNVLAVYSSLFNSHVEVNAELNDFGEWLSGDWQYRRSHVINPAFGAGSDYQVRIKAYYSSAAVARHYLTVWNKYESNPLFTPANNRAWPAVVYHDGVYYLYLGYYTGGSDIQLYTSTDGVNFTEHPNSPVIARGDSGSWEAYAIEPHSIIYINGQWRLYYCGLDSSGVWRIGYAYSSDLISWTKYSGNPIMSPVSPETSVADPQVFLWKGKIWMQYAARGFGGSSSWSLMAAWSDDGISFTRSSFNPVKVDAVPGGVYVLNDDEIYGLIRTYENGLWEVEAFQSFDGEHYTYYNNGENVIKVGGNGHWDAAEIGHLDIVKIGDAFKCYYAGRDSSNTFRIGLATATTVTEVSGEDDEVYLNGHCRTDFGDVRFTASDGVTLLDYWMETKVDGEYAVFWVKVADDLSTNPATIYVYYGNPSATTTSNGANTFLFFDDFLGTSYDSNKWQVVGSPTITVSNGELKIQRSSYSGSWSVHGLRSKTFQADEKRVIVKAKTSTFSDACNVRIDADYYSKGQTNKVNFEVASTRRIYLECDRRDIGGGISSLVMLSGAQTDTYYTFYVTRESGSYSKGWLNWRYTGQVTSNVNDGSAYIGLFIEEWSSHGTIVGTYDYIAVAKYVDPEPTHGSWGSEEAGEHVTIDEAFASDERADIESIQTVSFHAKWNNGSDVIRGSIYVNGTEYVTDETGWIHFNVTSTQIGKQKWAVTAVNCGGVTTYTQTASNPTIIWDQIQIIDGGISKENAILGETVTVWFQAKYQYDNKIFDGNSGTLYVNSLQMLWSTANNRWEHQYTLTEPGTKIFTITEILDTLYGLTAWNEVVGAQAVTVWSTPFYIISNSTFSELTFDSTTKTITFTVAGPTGTTGYTNVTIAKALIENMTDLTIYLDENPINYTATSTEYTWTISFNYTHSTHKVTILLSSQPNTKPQNLQPTTAIITIILLGTVIATPLICRKLRKR